MSAVADWCSAANLGGRALILGRREVKVVSGHIAALKLSQSVCAFITLGVNSPGFDKGNKGEGSAHTAQLPLLSV